jgi:hypothetical protein
MSGSGLKSILFSLYQQPCPIPFSCAEQTYEEEGNHIIRLSVDSGKCQIRHGPAPESPPPPQDDSASIDLLVSDGNVVGEGPDEEIQRQAIQISKHIYQAIPDLYDRGVTHLRLHFSVRDGAFKLLPDSDCALSTQTLMKNDPELERRFAEFYVDECQGDLDLHSCCQKLPDCGPPHYRIPLTLITLYRAEQRFPSANPGQLYTLVLLRVPADTDKFGYSCIRCWHNISTAEYLAHCSRRDLPELRSVPPKPFQALVDSELFEKRKFPVGMNDRMHNPHSFVLNVVHSPYRVRAPSPKRPEKAVRPPIRPLKPWDSQPDWVKRHLNTASSVRRDCALSRWCPTADLSRPQLPLFPESTAPLGRATKSYTRKPYDVGLLDPKHKKRLHKRGDEDHYTRFDLDVWIV